MVNVYALWLGGGAPPGNWSLNDSTPDGKYFRNSATAFLTGGAATHTLLTEGTAYNDVSDFNSEGVYGYIQSGEAKGQGISIGYHNHSLFDSYVTVAAANNSPSYYTFRLIKCNIATFFSSERKLPQNAVMASTVALTSSEMTRHTASDGRLVKISYSTAGLTGGSDTHGHLVTGETLTASTTSYMLDYNATPYDILDGDTQHKHLIPEGTYSPSAISKPARVVTRLYQVTATNTTIIPVNAVLWVDGSISGYETFFETLTGWNDYFLEGGNQSAGVTGENTHNHGSLVTGTLNQSAVAATSKSNQTSHYDINNCIRKTHTHAFEIGIRTTQKDHTPLYWSLIPVRVKLAINVEQTKTTSSSMDLLLKKTRTTSGSFDVVLHKEGSVYTSMDVQLKKFNLTNTYSMDAIIKRNRQATTDMDVLLQRRRLLAAYLMSLAPLFAKNVKYTMSTRLVYEDKPPIYPVIDVLYSSWAYQFDKIHKKIVTAGLDLSLDTAGATALEKRWGRAFNLPREPGESDTYYKKRLLAFTASTTGCGTKKALQDVLNVASDGDSAQIDVFPGKVLIRYTDPLQLKRAKSREDLINGLLATSVAAGVEYYTPYPFKEYSLDMLLKKEGVTLFYPVNMALQATRETGYDMDFLIRGKQDLAYEMNTLIMKSRTLNYLTGLYLRRGLSQDYEMDLRMKKALSSSFEMGLGIRKIRSLPLLIDALLLKTKKKTSIYDVVIKWIGECPYSFSILVKGKASATYGMGLEIVGGES